ncbi:SDR family NAD(P)-dependent oxidoreductase [Halomonas icarae]|uniref:Glucose 1-dehydrogenase n=1 Tax=Halomonas icarae TaxID=2691040 RepID=A0A7X4W075_9GAMM|nr:SDR family oxidoreductase [Halomonas icarae]MDR5902994.1 SDR family NAD(P)-dependent oxidoreductase [Halomonas icarae]NAW13569.1 glucose 1-dehydrogenase [Halomonas icarae]
MREQLDGVAVVTGAASGIGRATALLLAERGFHVVAVDINAQSLEALSAEAGERALTTLACDVAAPDTPARIAEAVDGLGKPWRVLINNAGIAASPALQETSDDDIDRFIGINVASVFRLCRTALPIMAEQGGGSVVNLASVFGLTGVSGTSIYALTKGAVAALTVQLACEWGRRGVRVNAVAPGLIDTPLTAARIRDGAWTQRRILEETPLGRAGTPQDVAETIAFLASPRSAFITGEVLKVDGGWLSGRLGPRPEEGA